MKIFIVTAGRPNRQITVKNISPNTRYDVRLLVPEREKYVYETKGYPFPCVAHRKIGIAATRQFCIDMCEDKMMMLDDDITFYKREEDGKFTRALPDLVDELFQLIEDKLDEYAHVGVCDKFMSNMQPRGFISNKRYNQVMAYNIRKFPVPNPTFRYDIIEDQDFNLQLLNRSRPSYITTEWSRSSVPYAEGGCNLFRTPEVEQKAHDKLVEYWPGIVSLKPSKSTISGTSVAIKWRKAYVENTDLHTV